MQSSKRRIKFRNEEGEAEHAGNPEPLGAPWLGAAGSWVSYFNEAAGRIWCLGLSRYRHAITGAKSRTADDSPGGILADDMGLGKTLTMIAAIVGSYDWANEYSAQSSSQSATSETPLFLKATLIVVPSECESDERLWIFKKLKGFLLVLMVNWTEEIDK